MKAAEPVAVRLQAEVEIRCVVMENEVAMVIPQAVWLHVAREELFAEQG